MHAWISVQRSYLYACLKMARPKCYISPIWGNTPSNLTATKFCMWGHPFPGVNNYARFYLYHPSSLRGVTPKIHFSNRLDRWPLQKLSSTELRWWLHMPFEFDRWRSFKVIDSCTSRKPIYDFLLVINCDLTGDLYKSLSSTELRCDTNARYTTVKIARFAPKCYRLMGLKLT